MAPASEVSLFWLARHELRVALRDNRASPLLRTIIVILVLLVPSVVGTALAFSVRDVPDMPREVFGYVAIAAVVTVFLLLSGAGVYVLRRFHDRSDLDLLLSAPVSPARVFAAKALAVYVSVGLPMLIFVGPFLIASALLGHPGWLGGIVMVMVAAVMASSLAFVTSSWLLRLVGPRRGRTIIQVASGAFAALIAVAGQSVNFAPALFYGVTDRFATPPPPPLDWPARAVFGEPLPLAVMVLLALGSALVAARVASRDLGQPQQFAPVAARHRRPARFAGGLFRILVTKELRLLGRDPELVAVIALQMAYMIPAFGLIFAGGLVSPARLAAAVVLFAGLLTSSLAWLTLCGEDAPELIAAAPVADDLVVRAKLTAACLPALLLVLPAVALIAAMDVRAGLLALLLSPTAALAAGVQQFWAGKPQPRRTFRFRQKGSMLLALSEYAMAGCWSAAASLAVRGSPWALLAGLGAATVLGLSWLARARR